MSRLLPIALCLIALIVSWRGGSNHETATVTAVENDKIAPNGKSAATEDRLIVEAAQDEAGWLTDAVSRDGGFELKLDSFPAMSVVLRPSIILGESFQINLGTQQAIEQPNQLYQGYAIIPSHRGTAWPLSFAVVGDHAHAQIMLPDGREILVAAEMATNEFRAWHVDPAHDLSCQIHHDVATMRMSREPHHVPKPLEVSITPRRAAQGGFEPSNELVDKYVDPIPFSERYARSLKDLPLLVVLDKAATGSASQAHLESVASRWLASIANAASVYENQLGLRLRLQELILTPDSDDYIDIESRQVLRDFIDWLALRRNRNIFEWEAAIKVGDGLPSDVMGLAFVGSLGRSDGIGAIRDISGWATLAHELGHVVGADHTNGGIMHMRNNGGGNRSFFTDVSKASRLTAAKQIYDLASAQLEGVPLLRHATEMPFAKNDFRVIETNGALRFDPTQNDERHVRHGLHNAALSVEDVSQVTPSHAGTVTRDEDQVIFTPAENYEGVAWFSYALRGSVGNDGNGWLHKGDVTVQVGTPSPSARSLTLYPGQLYTLTAPQGSFGLTQPEQATIRFVFDVDDQILIQVNADATGEDRFALGDQDYQIHYLPNTLELQPLSYWMHARAANALRLFPFTHAQLPEDSLLGSGRISVGAIDRGADITLATNHLRLISAENLHPDKGRLTVVTQPVTVNRERQDMPTGELQFESLADAQGTAEIRYTVENDAGLREEGQITIHLSGGNETLVPQDAVVRYRIPVNDEEHNRWMWTTYDDRSWPQGRLPVGYEDGRGYEDLITTDVGRQMVNANASIYLRIPFQVNDPESFTELLLRLRFDDGFVAYLNGWKILGENNPEDLTWDAAALEAREASRPVDFDLTETRSLLRKGENWLGIQALNHLIDSSDFLFMPELIALSSPRFAKIVSPGAQSVTVAPGTGVVFSAERLASPPLLPQGDVTLRWQVIQGPAAPPLAIEPRDDQCRIHFTEPGTYRVRLHAQDISGLITHEDVVVRVGESRSYDLAGDLVNAGLDRTIDGSDDGVQVSGIVEGGVPGMEGRPEWTLIHGPDGAEVDSANQLETTLRFQRPGSYRFQLSSTQTNVTTFDDVTIRVNMIDRDLISPTSLCHFTLATSDIPDDWMRPEFDDSQWHQGGNGLGYDFTGAYDPFIVTDVQDLVHLKHPGLLVRYPFELDQLDTVAQLLLTIRADDAYVAYLNGQEISRRDVPLLGLGPTSFAVRSTDEDAVEFAEPFAITSWQHLLRPGTNVLAVHALNHSLESSDFLVEVHLTADLGDGSLPPIGYREWREGQAFGDAAEGLHAADPDGDGLSNLAEFGLGKDPLVAERADAVLKVDADASNVFLRYTQRADLEGLGGAVLIESHPLEGPGQWRLWEPAATERRPLEGGVEEVSLTSPRGAERSVFRLRVVF